MKKSREKKHQQFLALTKPSKDSKLLDVGVAVREFSPYDNYLEKKYPYTNKITALSIHPLDKFSKLYPDVKAVTYEGGRFPFKDKEFSIVYSNAVIEHVGNFPHQLVFINEMARVGRQFFFTTPAREFPIEIHTNIPFVHLFPKQICDYMLRVLGKEWAAGNYMNLLLKKDLKKLLKATGFKNFRLFVQKIGPFPLHYSVYGRN